MRFHQVIHKIRHPKDNYRKIINPFGNVEWFHTFECNFSLYEINNLLICPPDRFSLIKKTLNHSDKNFMSSIGWCPIYWYFDINPDKLTYGHTLYCEEALEEYDKDSYAGLAAYLRGLKIDSILDGLFIESQEV